MSKLNQSALTLTPLRGARQARGRSLRSVARGAGIDAAHLSRIERALATPSVEVLKRIADELELRELSEFLEPYVIGAAAA